MKSKGKDLEISNKSNINTANKNNLEKSCSMIKELKLIKVNDSKTTTSKRSKIANTINNNNQNDEKTLRNI